MGLQPESEPGKRLASVLENWMDNADDPALNKLKRLLYITCTHPK